MSSSGALYPVLCCLLGLLVRSTGLQITSYAASESLVAQGTNTTLTCATDSPWFFCLWNSPQADRHCAIQAWTPVSTRRLFIFWLPDDPDPDINKELSLCEFGISTPLLFS